MKMQKHTIKALAIAVGVTAASGAAMADIFTATATVNSAITLAETTALDFGTIVATSSSDTDATIGGTATLEVSVNGTISTAASTGSATATVTSLIDGAPAELTVSGAPSFVTINVAEGTLNAMSHSSGAPAIPDFTITELQFDTSNSATAPDGTEGDATGVTDGTGAMTIIVGATIQVANDGNGTTYTDGTYSGDYEVLVTY